MDKKFIEQAKHIRIEYIRNLSNISGYEKKINGYKDELSEIQRNMKPDDQSLLVKMMNMEKKLKALENIMVPFAKKIKDLEKEADTLFENIKDRHPNMTPEDIQNELIPHLKEIKF